ncbi:trans-sulfuration enzyme family protein [Granulicella arctica]|uniref:Cystathionine gamma-lyase n=1 Tax=Granulicella arctica TaxID=940613 RepID=A0A7Y9PFI3_9BACT|nr:aminotransferase class I/II-fold pyridoxal phosphate-dependent enzyme [Granulicella arctica]NYF78980.1 cystathionine gamma-lyase [Granulicella arctica]
MSEAPILQPSTLAIHGNRVREKQSNSILFPIHQTATYVHETVGVTKGYGYSRGGNPTVNALEQAIAALEGTATALCFRSGMGAISTLCLALLKAGDHVILSEVVYGGTIRLFRQVLENFAIEYSFVDTADLDAVRQAIRPNSKLLFVETPANPTMKLADVAALAEIAHAKGLLLAVDNTFLTPLLQDVLKLGADISMLSTTKYIDGHNATIGGSLATHDETLTERLRLVRKTLGTIQAPFDAWLTLQGLKTLPARLELHCRHAAAVAAWLEADSRVHCVNYPGLDSFAQKAIAERQQSGFGGMLSFELDASVEESLRFIDALKLCTCAESLGSVETLVTNPATASHCDLSSEERAKLGVSDRLIRLSVGLEAPQDLIADFEQAFAAVFGADGGAR